MKHKANDVTWKSNPRYMPATHNTNVPGAVSEMPGTSARPANLTKRVSEFTGNKLTKQVSGFGQGIRSAPSPSPVSSLPESVSARDIKAQSFRYGGGRSAGNRSLASNFSRKVNEQ
jgi:hypothetical protein